MRRLIKAIGICSIYRLWLHFIGFSLDVLYWIQIRTEDRPWHDSDVLLMEKVPGGSGSECEGIVLLEHMMLLMAKIVHNMKTKDLIDISQSRDAITSTWAIILTGPDLWLIPMAPQTMMLFPPLESLSITHASA